MDGYYQDSKMLANLICWQMKFHPHNLCYFILFVLVSLYPFMDFIVTDAIVTEV